MCTFQLGVLENLEPWYVSEVVDPLTLVWSSSELVCGDEEASSLVEKLLIEQGAMVTRRVRSQVVNLSGLWHQSQSQDGYSHVEKTHHALFLIAPLTICCALVPSGPPLALGHHSAAAS